MKRRRFLKGAAKSILGLATIPVVAKASPVLFMTEGERDEFVGYSRTESIRINPIEFEPPAIGDTVIYENGEKMTITKVKSTPDGNGIEWKFANYETQYKPARHLFEELGKAFDLPARKA